MIRKQCIGNYGKLVLNRKYLLIVCFLLATVTLYGQKKHRQLTHPIVVLTFDDAVESHYSVVAPLLKKFNFGATFFVCEYPLKSLSDSIDFMKWPQISKLHKMGFEIGNHTGHHKNVTKLSRGQIKEEIQYIERKCKEHNISKPVSFAYPGNRSDSLSQVVLKEMGYRYARIGGSKFYEPDTDNRLQIPSFTVTNAERIRERVMNALKELKAGQVLVLTIHGVPYLSNPDYSTSPALFTEYLQYMKDNQFKVIALRDLGKYYRD